MSDERRKVYISSDEDCSSPEIQNRRKTFAVIRPPTPILTSPEYAENSFNEDEESGSSHSFFSQAVSNTSKASVISSTPRSSTFTFDKRSGHFDDYSDHDRSRSFRSEDEPFTPISSKLNEKKDTQSQQKLRERLLKKNMMKGKAKKEDDERTSSQLTTATLSPIPKQEASYISDAQSPMSVDTDRNSDEKEHSEEEIVSNDEITSSDESDEGNVFSENEHSVVSVSSDESLVIPDSDQEPEPAATSIVVLSSDDEIKSRLDGADVNKENAHRDLPDHLTKYAADSVEDLEAKKYRIEAMIKNKKNLNLADGGQKLHKSLSDLEEIIGLKQNMAPPEDRRNKAEDLPITEDIHHQRRPIMIDPPKFDPSYESRLLTNDKKRLFGGKMTDNRLGLIQGATEKLLKGMHTALQSMPDETNLLETPKGLKIDLMHHQKRGLAWMVWREVQAAPGGILADDMGLGKTLSAISLILHQKNELLKRKDEGTDENDKKRREMVKKMGLVPSHTTLVVAPASVIYQWEAEIDNRVKSDRLNVHVFHGPKNRRIDDPKRLARYDIVITTYQLLATEFTEKITTQNNDDDASDNSEDENDDWRDQAGVAKKNKKRGMNSDSVLAKVAFERVILDEAHQIKNRATGASKAACRLSARNHWCLTGTPIHNNLWDLFSLVRFMRVSPFDDDTHWKEYIMSSSDKSADRLNLLTKSLLLRRTKDQTCSISNKPLVDLQPKVYKRHDLVLEGMEAAVYDVMFTASKQKVQKMLNDADMEEYERLYGVRRRKKKQAEDKVVNPFRRVGSVDGKDKFQAMSEMFILLLRLRQACVHMHLTKKAVEMDAFEHLGGDADADAFLERTMAELTLDENIDKQDGASNAAQIFERDYLSCKLKKTLEIIEEVLEMGDKIVVVSQWSSLLSIVEDQLKDRKAFYTVISGAIVPALRQERVDDFNRTNGGPSIMLLSLTAGGVGLNLIGGNHLIMVDLHWNPALEAQACDRIYRMGQKKTVYIHRLIATGTIEQKVVALQERKLELASTVLDSTAAAKKLMKLSMQDMRYLFELEDKKGARAQPNKSDKS